jgi:hypothetical protein
VHYSVISDTLTGLFSRQLFVTAKARQSPLAAQIGIGNATSAQGWELQAIASSVIA